MFSCLSVKQYCTRRFCYSSVFDHLLNIVHYLTLCVRIAELEELNKMPVVNLASIFGPIMMNVDNVRVMNHLCHVIATIVIVCGKSRSLELLHYIT